VEVKELFSQTRRRAVFKAKKTWLASLAVAGVSLAAPTSAAADQWADNGVSIGSGVQITQAYEGYLVINTGATGQFECEATITLQTNGPSAAQVTSFNTTTTCFGTVAFKDCQLIAEKFNLPWTVNNFLTPLKVTGPGVENVRLHNEYSVNSCAGKQTTSQLEFAVLNIQTEGTNPITKLTISGKSTSGVPISGSLLPEGTPTLGLNW
jgi:hypothetical protein